MLVRVGLKLGTGSVHGMVALVREPRTTGGRRWGGCARSLDRRASSTKAAEASYLLAVKLPEPAALLQQCSRKETRSVARVNLQVSVRELVSIYARFGKLSQAAGSPLEGQAECLTQEGEKTWR